MAKKKEPGFDDIFGTFFKGATGQETRSAQEKKQKKEEPGKIVLTTNPDIPFASSAPSASRSMDTAALQKMNDDIMAQINEMNRQLAQDEQKWQTGNAEKKQPAAQKKPLASPRGEDADKAFEAVRAVLETSIVGQGPFLEELLIAFKRPFIMGQEEGKAANTILVMGPNGSGKHAAVKEITRAMHEKGLMASPGIDYIDLSLYPSGEQRQLFLQDLYRALITPENVLVFDHFEQCHPSILNMLSSLVQTGTIPLTSRYLLQKGVLVEAGSALSPDMISSLTLGGQYLVFVTTSSPSKVADAFGAPFVNAIGDTCRTGEFSPESLLAIAAKQMEWLAARAHSQLGYTVCFEAGCDAHFSSFYSRENGVEGIIQYTQRCYKALSEHKLRHSGGSTANLRVENSVLCVDFGEGAQPLLSILPGSYAGELDAIKAELDKIVGLVEVKDYILSLEENIQVQKLRKSQGMPVSNLSMHMIFTGNPGTGKTTIARLISKYLKAIGALSGGQLVEVSRADLVGRYVGHTAPLTNQVLQSAAGGVLFIDEAYSLYRGKDDSFGLEAIDTLVKGMEDNRDDMVVILAGYSREMAEFLTANSGLRSRFPNIIEFPDYTGDELVEIAYINAEKQGYHLDESCRRPLRSYFERVQKQNAREAGNGRLARNKVEEAILNQSRRVTREGGALDLLLPHDFEL